MNTLELICSHWKVSLVGASPKKPIIVPGISRNRQLPYLFKAAGFKIGAEIGVERGLYSKRLCQAIPGLKLFGIDCWTTSPGYREHVSQDVLDHFYQSALKRVKPYNCRLIKEWSVEAAKRFKNESLDFVYIDANHDFANVVRDLYAWIPKVRLGGVVSGHDFGRVKNSKSPHHVPQAIRAWTECYQVSPWFILGTKEKVKGIPRDDERSWMWVK